MSRNETRTPADPFAPLEERTREELYETARELEVEGRSQMTKEELIRGIRENLPAPH